MQGEAAPAGILVAEPQASSARADLAAPLDPRLSFDSFVVGKPNEFAHACARRVAERPSSPGFNPLFLYGGVGLGKTHLMHAIGLELARGGRVSVAYMSAEKFMYRFIAAIRSQSTMEFKEQLRSVDVLMIDDLQFLIGKDNTQEEFFHTFNALVDVGKQIVVSAHANLFGRPVTLDATQEVLHDILKAHDRRVTIEEIQRKVAEHWNIRLTDMSSARRARAVARPRQVAMFLAKQLTSRSLPEIGRKFGNRDHTTVMHAVSRVTELMEVDTAFAEDVELLRRMLES